MPNHLQLFINSVFVIAMLVGLAAPAAGSGLAQTAHKTVQSQLVVYSVTNTNDSGAGSLRQAILDANANPGLDTISFAIGAAGSQQTIQLLSSLPAITGPALLDGWSQGGAGFTGPPLIEIIGLGSSFYSTGLTITGGLSTVRGLVLNGFYGVNGCAICLQTGGENWIYGNHIGVNLAGDAKVGNVRGIWIDKGSSHNRIGTNADGVNDAAERNVISGNSDQNIYLYDSLANGITGNKIAGNYIGLNAGGTAAISTGGVNQTENGILVYEAANTVIGTDGDGQGDALEGNVISGNTFNVFLMYDSSDSRVSGNRIGTNAAGTAGAGYQSEGVRVFSSNHLVGTDGDGISDALEGNLISGNNDFGIMLQQSSSLNNVVAGNKIGTDITGLYAIPNGIISSPRAGILLGGIGNRIGTNSDGISDDLERNLISGNANVAVYAIYFNNLPNAGAPATIIAGNWMGLDATGLAALPNNYGIGGTSNVPTVIRDNVIAASTYEGISTNSSGMLITGNRIGLGADGITPLGNGYNGIFISGNNNIIGGTGPGEANIIANNGTVSPYYSGIRVSNTGLSNTIRANRIYANSQLGIDLRWPDGVNLNDLEDPDAGGNNLQNFPVISFAQAYANGTTRIQGTLNSSPNITFTLDFYYSAAADPSGYGEGEFYLGETSVTTGVDGNAAFDVTLPVTVPPSVFVSATATHADGSTSEFSLAFAAGGVIDVPVTGLSAAHTGLGYTNSPVTFSASVTAGTGLSYEWNLGDGSLAAGPLVEHAYTTPGVYTATVTASNNGSSAQAQTVVAVVEPANINGYVWEDKDIDGIQGIGEPGLPEISVSAVGPTGTIAVTTDAQGRYQIFTPSAGVYEVSASSAGMTPTTASPIPVPMGEDGGTVANFGLHATPADGFGYVTGRAWIDLDGSGFPEPDEEPLAGLELDFYGYQYPWQTITTDSDGLFSLSLPSERVYWFQLSAPGFYPDERKFEWVWLDSAAPLMNLHAPFGRGGTVSGRVVNTSGAGVPNAIMTIGSPGASTLTDANGDYTFLEQAPSENKSLGLYPPYPYANYSGSPSGFRVFPLPLNSVVFENWLVERRGRLTIHAQQTIGEQTLPVGFVFFSLQGGFVDIWEVTGLNGQTWEDLEAGTYTITPLTEYLPPGALISPSSRTVVVTNETFVNAEFNVTLAQSLAVACESGGVGFACTVEVYDTDGNLVTTVDLSGASPETVIADLPAGSYEVVVIPAEPGWPESSSVVTLDGSTHAEVSYPYNPSNLQTISGYAYWDRCVPSGVRGNGSYCTETNIPSNNDIPVTLYNAGGTIISSTLTAAGAGWNTGYYAFSNLPVGGYRVEISLPGGFTAQTPVSAWRSLDGYGSPEQLNFGYQRTENRSLTGYAFYDVNNNGSYDTGWDDPFAGAEVTVSTLGGTVISTHTTASDGSFTVTSITSGEYRVEMVTPDLQLARIAVVPAAGGVPWVQFPLPPNDNLPRAIVFVDSNQDGLPGSTEQRLGGVGVELYSQQCGGIAAPIETKTTNSDGLALFTNPLSLQAMINAPAAAEAAPGSSPGCAKIVSASLPANVLPANPNGTAMPKNSGVPVLLPVYPQGTLLVQVFWDVDGDGTYDSNEPLLSSGTASVGGQTKSYSENGAIFVLAEGSYSLNAVPPAGYQISAALPINVVVGAWATPLKIAARVAGGINGAVNGPNGALAGLTVRLTNLATNQVIDTPAAYGCAGCSGDALYQFANLPGGQYRLSIPTPPPGHILADEPVVNYTAGQTIQQNLTLNSLGYLSGSVYLDNNANGQRDNGEAAAPGYTVTLLNDGGLPVQTAAPDASGVYMFDNLTAGVRYLATIDLYVSPAASLSDSLTEAPGWFLPGMQLVQADFGIFQGGADYSYNTVFGRVTANGTGVAGARIGYFEWIAGQGCSQTNPSWQNLETFSDIHGDYKLLTWMLPGNAHTYCIAAREAPGYQQSYNPATPGTGSNFSYQTTGGAIVYQPGYWERNISLLQSAAQVSSLNAGANVYWSAFRDDNLNATWDGDEPALPGVSVGGDTTGVIGGLGNGMQALSIVSPAGYLPVQGSSISVWLNGAGVALPPLAFRFSAVLSGQVFSDEDGDGRQGVHEPGVPGVSLSLTGPAQANATTGSSGRFSLPNLPDGVYSVSIMPPDGYAAVPDQTITLSSGAAFSLPLHLLAQLSGAIYADWDGDGQRGGDEPAEITPLTVSAAGLGETRTALGSFRFWNAANGSYLLKTGWLAVDPVTAGVSSSGDGAVALPAVPAGVVRGTAWLDRNGDGKRQPWESPLAGVNVSLGGAQSMVSDQDGRFIFYNVTPGDYALSVDLPAGLKVSLPSVSVAEERGAAVGLPVAMNTGFTIHLPLINR